jgi:hypothetical protein
MLVGLLAIVYGRDAGRPLVAWIAEIAPAAGIAAASYGPGWCGTLLISGRAAAFAWAIAATVLYAALLRSAVPRSWDLVVRLLAPLAALRRPRREVSA